MKIDRGFFREMFKIAVPISLQNLILSSLNLVDTVVISSLGETAISGVGLANQFFFLLSLVLFGIASGASIFTAQYWGKKDITNIRRVLGIGLISAGGVAAIFSLVGLFFPRQVIAVFISDPEVIKLGGEYMGVIALSYVITAITFTYSFTLRSTGEVKLTLFVSTIALVLNTVLTYGMVFGYFGLPVLGVKGAALATLISRLVEMIMLLSLVYRRRHPIACNIREMFSFKFDFFKSYYKLTTPVILNETLWALGVTSYSLVYGRMGTEVVAAVNISGNIERLVWVTFMGIGNACAVMIGNRLGAGERESTVKLAYRFIKLGVSVAIGLGIALALVAPYIVNIFDVDALVKGFATRMLYVTSIILWVKCCNYLVIIGILRSGGDTKFCMLLDMGTIWSIGVPMAIIGGLVLKLPVYYVYAMICLEEVAKLGFGLRRVKGRKWVADVTI